MARPCILCCEQIPSGAKICTKCDAYQDWRRFFGVSGTILTLLVALVSVLAIGGPAVRNALTPNRSDVRCSLLAWTASGVTLVPLAPKASAQVVLDFFDVHRRWQPERNRQRSTVSAFDRTGV